jgi:effector-binding domain-containing protein
MIETPEVVETQSRPIAFIQMTVPRDAIQAVMGPGLREIMDAIAAQGVAPAGPWFTHHRRMDPEVFDFEITVPVARPVTASGRVVPGELPAMRVVRTVYRGGYEGLGDAWQEFDAWIESQGLATQPDLWEVYASGPEADPDPATWATELSRALRVG